MKEKNNIESSSVESMWFEIFPKHEKSFLIHVYRPPDSPSIWYEKFEKEIINASIMNKEILF